MSAPISVATAVRDLWQRTIEEIGAEKDFTTHALLVERSAGIGIK